MEKDPEDIDTVDLEYYIEKMRNTDKAKKAHEKEEHFYKLLRDGWSVGVARSKAKLTGNNDHRYLVKMSEKYRSFLGIRGSKPGRKGWG